MKKIIWSLVLIVVVAVIFYIINRKEGCATVELRKLTLNGDSQLLIGYSETKNDLLYLSMSFGEDTTGFNIFGKASGLLGKGFSYGDYLTDSVMLVFDQDQNPFLYKVATHQVDSLHSSINFKGLEMADIKVRKFRDHAGMFLNRVDSLVFYDVSNDSGVNVFSLSKLSEKYEGIKSFDVSVDKILVVLKRECLEGGCSYDYFLVNAGDNSFKKIFTLEKIKSITYSPMVSFLNPGSYVTGYSDDQAYVAKNSIDGGNEKKWCLGDLEVFNIGVVQGEVYVTVIDEQVRKSTASKNPFKNLYSGISIVSFGLQD